MDHRIEPGKDVAPIPLADPSEPLAAEGFRPGLRDEHVIQSTGESEPFALVEEGQQVTPASEQEVVQYIRSCEASSPENLAQLARDGLALLHRVDYTVSQELQGPYGRARRSYEALKHTIKQLKESVEKPAPVLDVAIKLLREYKERSVFKDRLATDSAFFDAVRLGVILGSGAGRRDEDISVGGGLNDDKRKAALERPTKEKPKRLTMEEKAALREEKRARLRAGAQPQPDQAEAAEPEEEATDDGTAEQELLQAETTQARAHLERAKELQQYFKAPLAVLTQPYQELKQKNPDLFQQKMYDLAASLADWLRAEADMGGKPTFDPETVRERAISKKDALSKFETLQGSLRESVKTVAKALAAQGDLRTLVPELGYELQQLIKEVPQGIHSIESSISDERVAQARREQHDAEAARQAERNTWSRDRWARDGEDRKVGGV